MRQSVVILNVCNTLTLKQIFWKTKTYLKKPECSFLVERIKIENTSFPYKTAISETNVKANRMMSTKWSFRKELTFANKYIFFFQNFVSVEEHVFWFDVPTT